MLRVFITTCSSQKVGGGHPYRDFETISSYQLPKLLKSRQKLFQLIKCGKIRGDLRGATEGPDFGGNHSGTYLSAINRYKAGSFVSALYRELDIAADSWLNENKLFFISGLYGIVSCFEPIQNYNVILDNTHDFWTRDIIMSSLMPGIGIPNKDTLIINCCSDSLYSGLVDWIQLEDMGFSVRHAIGGGFEDRQIRSASASVAANIDSKYERDRILRGSLIQCVDADIRFVSTEDYISSRLNNPVDMPRVRIGFIEMKPGDREEILKRFGAGLSRYIGFEFIDRNQGEEGLIKLKNIGCTQCLFRILDESHAEMRKGFGRDLQHEIRKHDMTPIGYRNFSQLNLGFAYAENS